MRSHQTCAATGRRTPHRRSTAIRCCMRSATWSTCWTRSASRRRSLPGTTGAEGWLHLGSIDFTRTNSSISVKYKRMKSNAYVVDDGTLSVTYDLSGPYFGKGKIDAVTLNEFASLVYSFTTPSSLESVTARYGVIQELFVILADSEYLLNWP